MVSPTTFYIYGASLRLGVGIKDVEDKLYAIEKSNRRAFTTKQHVVAAIGHTRQTIPFIYCSMGPINERDLVRYKSHATNDNEPLPKKAFLAAKSLAVGRLLHLHLDEAQLQERLKRSGVLAQKANAIERQALQVRRAEAEARGDDTPAAQPHRPPGRAGAPRRGLAPRPRHHRRPD